MILAAESSQKQYLMQEKGKGVSGGNKSLSDGQLSLENKSLVLLGKTLHCNTILQVVKNRNIDWLGD